MRHCSPPRSVSASKRISPRPTPCCSPSSLRHSSRWRAIYLDAKTGIRAPLGIALLFWAALAAGILVKGPVAPLVAALTIIALCVSERRARWLRDLRPIAGIVVLLLIVLPWLIAISTATQGRFLSDSLGQDFFGKLIGAQESHGAPPLYYLALLTITFWPGTLFLGPAIAWGWQQRRADAERFLIAWGVPFWIVLELVPTKLPNYLLPAYPALALVAGARAGRGERAASRFLAQARSHRHRSLGIGGHWPCYCADPRATALWPRRAWWRRRSSTGRALFRPAFVAPGVARLRARHSPSALP